MLRRPLFSQEVEYSHQTSPRKWSTVGRTTQLQPSIFRHHEMYKPHRDDFSGKKWIGKYLIPYQSMHCNKQCDREYISELEIMRSTGMFSYRLIFVTRTNKPNVYIIKSKPTIETSPGRLNLFITPQLLIVDAQYF
jgi:hypothetical protein